MTEKELKQENRKEKMLYEPLPKVITSMAIPCIVAFLITSIYGIADTYFVSGLGTNATAAVSVNASLDNIIMMAGSMVAIGANSYIARLLGAKKEDRANRVLSSAFFVAIIFGIAVLLLGTIFMEPMVMLLGATDTCKEYAMQYATYVLLVAPFMTANFVMNQCLRSEGASTRSMIGMGVGGIINCFLDPLFIIVFDMGVAGASIATAISKLISFAVLIWPYIPKKTILKIKLKYFRMDWEMIKEVTTIGSSSLFRTGLSIVAAIILNNLAGEYGDSVLAGIGVTTKIMMFPMGIILGYGQGFQPVVGYCWGAKNFKRVREAFNYVLKVALAGGVIMAIFLFFTANPLISLFAGEDPMMHEIGALSIRLQGIALCVHAWVVMVNMMCAGIGDAKNALLLSTARQGTCFIPIVYPLAMFLQATGVAAAQAVADGLTLFLAIPVVKSINKRIDAAEAEMNTVAA